LVAAGSLAFVLSGVFWIGLYNSIMAIADEMLAEVIANAMRGGVSRMLAEVIANAMRGGVSRMLAEVIANAMRGGVIGAAFGLVIDLIEQRRTTP
jgi:hypothetical protein